MDLCILQAWTSNSKVEVARVAASQRALASGGSAFNEMPGIRTADLSSDYYWTWYDNQSSAAADWVMIANPEGAAAPIYYDITIGGTPFVTNGGPIAAGAVSSEILAAKGGPVEVTTFTDRAHPGVSAAASICSQRTLWGPSFEEVPGQPAGGLTNLYIWPWYDQKTAGMTDWVLIANPGGSQIYYDLKINGTTEAAGKLLPRQEVHPFFANLSGQLVELRGWTDASETTQANVMGSQRVLFNGYFNELWGMPYNFG
ncbi:MAG: hypothetical protein ACYCXU_04355 [Thermoleophilia bacterium]